MNTSSTPTAPTEATKKHATAVLVFDDGSVLWGKGFGAHTNKDGQTVGEVCFNTSLTGYQEVLTDPSYAGQIINFTFPHIGNVGTNDADMETGKVVSRGAIIREDITNPSNFRSLQHFDEWMKLHHLPGIAGVDTRALTRKIRDGGAPNAVLAFPEDGEFDIPALIAQAQSWPGLKGMDLAKEVSCDAAYEWDEGLWSLSDDTSPLTRSSQSSDHPLPSGERESEGASLSRERGKAFKIAAIDYGAKRNILKCLVAAGFDVTVLPATSTAEEILALNPDGVFLSNGPGDPAATGEYAVPMIKTLIEKHIPIFGICLGHQLLAQALGAKTQKMHLGHRGANHPVKDLITGKVEITSQNHGFEVITDSLPDTVEATHISLFDGSNEGIKLKGKPVFSVQYHPEASPGPQDSFYLFERFRENIEKAKAA